MKLFIFFLLLVLQILLTLSAPSMEEFDSLRQNLEADNYDKHVRVRRFTCDVLAVFGNDVTRSACAFHCLMLGKHGGDCQNAICVCRSENIVDTLIKQFG
ncbi:defensin-like [Cotesia glomerata]|uniref:Invertebrate defensins family profile domain-containing protein n=1 Tax=Cotesia glomerata TaxID=32391 RepID=A0AAV7IDD9_COTGL|nr:defensin-like [Cotesia glomerata]KAH0549142.1 hypothetical protein KQX54_006528 [Cotesia glomerata]